MELKPSAAKVTDLTTRFEALPVETEIGPVIWADIEITYTLAGLLPTVDIRVPIPFKAGETDADRKREALRNARLLIDHACQIGGVPADKPVSAKVQDAIEEALPDALKGVTQELGLTSPTTKPKKSPR